MSFAVDHQQAEGLSRFARNVSFVRRRIGGKHRNANASNTRLFGHTRAYDDPHWSGASAPNTSESVESEFDPICGRGVGRPLLFVLEWQRIKCHFLLHTGGHTVDKTIWATIKMETQTNWSLTARHDDQWAEGHPVGYAVVQLLPPIEKVKLPTRRNDAFVGWRGARRRFAAALPLIKYRGSLYCTLR